MTRRRALLLAVALLLIPHPRVEARQDKLVPAPDQNPLQNLMVLYGTGHLRLNDRTGRNERVGGVRSTIKDGIVYDAKKLLADVAAMVEARKKQRGTVSQ